MNIGARLEAIAALVLQNCVVADIGTDHAYLPVWLMQKGLIKAAIAADIAEGPCKAAQTNIGMYGLKDKIEVRRGSGLTVLKPERPTARLLPEWAAALLCRFWKKARM